MYPLDTLYILNYLVFNKLSDNILSSYLVIPHRLQGIVITHSQAFKTLKWMCYLADNHPLVPLLRQKTHKKKL